MTQQLGTVDTSQAIYEAAATRHETALNNVKAAKIALAAAEQEYDLAEANLRRHEYKPGVALYLRQHAGCPSGNADLAPHRACPACGRQQYMALSGHWTHCLHTDQTECPA